MNYVVESETLTEQPTAVVRRTVPLAEVAEWMPRSYETIFGYLSGTGVAPAGPPYARYAIHGGSIDIEAGVPVSSPIAGDDAVRPGRLPGGPAAVTLHRGPYETVDQAMAALGRWVAEHGYRPRGQPFESYLTDPVAEPDPVDWRTVVVMPYAS